MYIRTSSYTETPFYFTYILSVQSYEQCFVRLPYSSTTIHLVLEYLYTDEVRSLESKLQYLKVLYQLSIYGYLCTAAPYNLCTYVPLCLCCYHMWCSLCTQYNESVVVKLCYVCKNIFILKCVRIPVSTGGL